MQIWGIVILFLHAASQKELDSFILKNTELSYLCLLCPED